MPPFSDLGMLHAVTQRTPLRPDVYRSFYCLQTCLCASASLVNTLDKSDPDSGKVNQRRLRRRRTGQTVRAATAVLGANRSTFGDSISKCDQSHTITLCNLNSLVTVMKRKRVSNRRKYAMFKRVQA
jgi:hypothetical protein